MGDAIISVRLGAPAARPRCRWGQDAGAVGLGQSDDTPEIDARLCRVLPAPALPRPGSDLPEQMAAHRWGRDAGSFSLGPHDDGTQGRRPLRGALPRPAMPRVTPALLAHLAVLAGLIWLTAWPSRAPEPLPKSDLAMVFAPPKPAPPKPPPPKTAEPPLAQPVVPPPPPPVPAMPAPAAVAPPAPGALPVPPPPPPETAALPPQPALPLPPPPAPRPPMRRVAARPPRLPVIHTPPRLNPPAVPQVAIAPVTPPARTVPPRPIAAVAGDRPPLYPELARRRGEQGRVLLKVRVGTNGVPVAVMVAQTSGYSSLDHAAIAAVERWRFLPALQDGQPVVGIAEIPVQFRLSD